MGGAHVEVARADEVALHGCDGRLERSGLSYSFWKPSTPFHRSSALFGSFSFRASSSGLSASFRFAASFSPTTAARNLRAVSFSATLSESNSPFTWQALHFTPKPFE